MTQDLVIFAPGSMTHLLPRLLKAYDPQQTLNIQCVFGPSGSLRAKIEGGQLFHLFLSASSTHTQALSATNHLAEEDILGYNRMVLVHQRKHQLNQSNALKALTQKSLTVGMSTTGLDPAGDYAFEILKKVSDATTISLETLERRTRVITGGRETPNAPPGRNQYGWIMETQNVDLLLTYYSNALAAMEDNPYIGYCELPEQIAVIGTYGIGRGNVSYPEASALYHWFFSTDAQIILKDGGFIPKSAGEK